MTKQVLFVQGGGGGTHDQWDNKLVASLEKHLDRGHVVHYPRMPNEDEPDVAAWGNTIRTELEKLSDVVVVGHSIGGAILLDCLADGGFATRLAGVFLLAAPYIGEGGWPLDDVRATKDVAAKLPADTPIYLYQGDADDTVSLAHVNLLAKAFPQAIVRRLKGRDHQLNDDLSEVAHDISRLG